MVLVDPILRQTKEPPLLHKFNRIRGIPQPGGQLTAAFFARAYELTVIIRRYRAAVPQAAAALDKSPAHRNRGCRADDDR